MFGRLLKDPLVPGTESLETGASSDALPFTTPFVPRCSVPRFCLFLDPSVPGTENLTYSLLFVTLLSHAFRPEAGQNVPQYF
jgi:hypothetical protein